MAFAGSKVAYAILLVLLLAGCSSSGTIMMQQPKTASIPPGKTLSLSFETAMPPGASSEQIAEFKEVGQRVKATLFGRLVSEGVFKQVLQPGETSDYRMIVTLTNANKVSQGARIFAGVFAGSNLLNADVQLFDESNKNLVTSFRVTGESASHPLSTEAGLDDAVREAVDEILLALQ